jgi:hypothetical protein
MEVSLDVATACGKGAQKLGHPVPLSNFVVDENTDKSQPAQWYVPFRFSTSSGLEPAISVPCLRKTS